MPWELSISRASSGCIRLDMWAKILDLMSIVQVRKAARTQRVREYFYGVRGDLSPHSQTVRADELRLYRIGGGPRAPSSALPLGTHASTSPAVLSKMMSSKNFTTCFMCALLKVVPGKYLAGFGYTSILEREVPEWLLPCLAS